MIREAIRDVVERHDLSCDVARSVMLEIIGGRATPSQVASFATAMRMKGETQEELKGFVLAMRQLATRVSAPEGAVDLCGTGGDGSGSFNISTASSFVVAAAGVPVAKHGNRSMSSRCGSADALAALGISVDMGPEQVEACLAQTGMGFMFAPRFHESMRNVAATRREIGVRTFFNILGPMTNPAMVRRQLIGVYDRSLASKMAAVLRDLGSSHIIIAHGSGMDEITNLGETHILEMRDGVAREYTVSPSDFGLDMAEPEDLRGGDPLCNARIMLSVLRGERSPRADVVALNAGAAIYAGGKACSMHEGVDMALELLRDGRGLAKLWEFAEKVRTIEVEAQKSMGPKSLIERRVLPEVMCTRAEEISAALAERISALEGGQAALRALDPAMLMEPNALSVIVLERMLSILSDGLVQPPKADHEHSSLLRRIRESEGIALIAEYKPKSPASPPLHLPPEPEHAASAFSSRSIAGVSVLVEQKYFSGGPDMFSFFRQRLSLPMLFKDFVVTEEQLELASRLGSDAVLLIAKVLHRDALDRLIHSCLSRGLEPLAEVHDEQDLTKLSGTEAFDSIKMVGVNCRDLRTLETDLGVFARLRPSLPENKVVIAESGIRTVTDIKRVRSADAVLIGSMLMSNEDLCSGLDSVLKACREAR